MRSPISLLILGVNAAIAASLIGAIPVRAEPGLPRSSTSKAETLPLDLPTGASTDASTEEATRSTVAQDSLDTQSDRLDRLQQQIEIRQQLNQAEFRSNSQPLDPDFNPLELEQAVQQQINLQNLDDLQQEAGTSPSRTLDRLQFEQRVRQQLRQPTLLEDKTTLAEASSADSNTDDSRVDAAVAESNSGSEASSPAPAIASQPADAADAAEKPGDSPEDRSTAAANRSEGTATAEAERNQPAVAASNSAEAADQANTPKSESASATDSPADAANATAAEPPALSQAPAASPESTSTDKPEDRSEAEPEAETGAEPESTEAAQSGRPASDTPAEPDAKPQRTVEQAEDRIDRQNRDYPNNSLAPAPEYLDPDPNPLSLPTLPEEVEIVGTQPITLRQAVELALRNNPELRQSQIQVEQSQAQLREAQAANFPTVDAQTSFVQSGTEVTVQQPVPPATPGGPSTTETTVVYQDSTALGAQLQVQYPIFTSGRRSALIQSAESQVRLQQLQLEQTTEQLILDTTSDYYDLQQASAQVNIFTANLTQAEQSLRDAQALERAGVGTRFDVLQAEVDVANARQDLTQQISQLTIARRQLAQRLNVSQSVNLEAADIVEVAGVWDLTLEESIVQAYKNRSELEQPLIQQEIAQQQRRAALAQLGPQLGFNGIFGLANNLDEDPRFLYNYRLALTASLSLFDGGEARAQANQQESAIAIAQAQFEQARDQIRFQVEQAYSQLDSNFSNIQTTALAVEQAAEALRLARLRFQAGVGTQTDVLRQQTALAQAQVNNLRAILDYNRALAALQRSISNYPEGYLNDQP